MNRSTFRTLHFKIYPNRGQEILLSSYLAVCCRIYNLAISQRRDRYDNSKLRTAYKHQQSWLTKSRKDMHWISQVPVEFARDPLRRVDRAFKGFFQRIENRQSAGYPRFKNARRYRSIECVMPCKYVRDRKVYVTGVGLVAAKGQFGKISCEDSQKSIRVMRRSDGWYAQVVVETSVKQLPDTVTSVGIDVGLEHFATLSDGELIENPRFLRKHEKKLKTAQRQLSRKQKGSNRRDKTRKRVAKLHEKVARKRRGFLHRVSTQIVRSYGRIAVEKLTIRNMVKNRRLAKSISDAGWYTFRQMLAYKAESAGREYVEVNPAGTSQECPDCGEIRKKDLSERIHNCSCGCQMSRDLAAAVVIEKRAFRRAAQSCGKTSSDVSQDRQRRRSAKTRCCDLSQRIVTIKG